MTHPMNLHGHVFQVVEIAGFAINGPLHDTVLVPPLGDCVVILDADQPGVWAFHCQILYHALSGMFTVLRYEGFSTKEWRPELAAHETLWKG
jgi:FtsP/CotA-like multicopper oxidase with cupredoxin domain